jgi:hypothetical protein
MAFCSMSISCPARGFEALRAIEALRVYRRERRYGICQVGSIEALGKPALGCLPLIDYMLPSPVALAATPKLANFQPT